MAGLPLKDLKDLRILNQLSEIYFQNTGMVISFQGPGEDDAVIFYPQDQRCEYCRIVQSTPEGLRRCLASDHERLAIARRKGSFYIAPCHAGLVDVIIPLDHHGVEYGAMYTGQVLLEEPNLQRALALYGRLDLPGVSFEAFVDAYSRVKVVESGRLLFYAKLLHLMGNYIILAESEIHLSRMVVLKDRELHRREMERIQLEKTLKDLTISVLESGTRRRAAEAESPAEAAKAESIISRAQLFIRANYGHDLMLEDVARAVYLSPNYFSSLFKRVAGCSFRHYLARKRIEAAEDLLARTDLPIKEIVFRTGFKDYNYFNRTFRRLAGLAPAGYRSRYRKAAEQTPGGTAGAPDSADGIAPDGPP